jgi:hypothetical protein
MPSLSGLTTLSLARGTTSHLELIPQLLQVFLHKFNAGHGHILSHGRMHAVGKFQ